MPKIDAEVVMELVQQEALPFSKEDEDLVRWWCEMAPTVIQEKLQELKIAIAALTEAQAVRVPPDGFLWIQPPEDVPPEMLESIQDAFSSLPEGIAGKIIIAGRDVEFQTLSGPQLDMLGLARVSNNGQERSGKNMEEEVS